MKAVIQRVLQAHATVNNKIINKIEQGLCVLVGIADNDTEEDMKFIIKKILNGRYFHNETKPWADSVLSKNYEILIVSQFTLCYQFKGNRLSFHKAMEHQKAKDFYNKFLQEINKLCDKEYIKGCPFGATLELHIVNDGPVTIDIDTKREQAVTSQEVS